jgi:plasmid segregation protein ParM
MQRDHQVIVIEVCGVDVGHANVKYSLARNGRAAVPVGIFQAVAPKSDAAAIRNDPNQQKRDVCFVEIKGVRYVVGPDAHTNVPGRQPRSMSRSYCLSAEYMALMRGAIYMAARAEGDAAEYVIQELVLGLPLTTFAEFRGELQRLAVGEHIVVGMDGAPRRVTVQSAHVVLQPFGAMINHAARQAEPPGIRTLVVDAGGGTLDWYVAVDGQTNWERSGAFPRAMLACAYAVADRMGPGVRDNLEMVRRIDKAIRDDDKTFATNKGPRQLSDDKGVIETVLSEGVEAMLASVESLVDFDRVLVTGGGAPVYCRYLKERVPEINSLSIDAEPILSNVRGFHLWGEIKATTRRAR